MQKHWKCKYHKISTFDTGYPYDSSLRRKCAEITHISLYTMDLLKDCEVKEEWS